MSQCQPQARRRFSWPFQSLLQEPTPVTAGAARRPGPSSLCVLCGRPGRSLDVLPAVGAWWAQRWAQSRSSCPGFAWLRNSSSRRPASVRAAGVRCGRPLAGARVRAPSRPCSLHGTARQAQHARHSTPAPARDLASDPLRSLTTRCAPYAPATFGLNSAPARPRSICLPHPRSLFWALGPSDLPADTVLPNPSPSPQVPGGPCRLQLPREGKAFTHPHPPPPTAGVPSTPADKGRARRGWVWCWAVPARVSLGVAEW